VSRQCDQAETRFPLYAKGVERYRYEYAVFLLNKNIETVWSIAIAQLTTVDARMQQPSARSEAYIAKSENALAHAILATAHYVYRTDSPAFALFNLHQQSIIVSRHFGRMATAVRFSGECGEFEWGEKPCEGCDTGLRDFGDARIAELTCQAVGAETELGLAGSRQ